MENEPAPQPVKVAISIGDANGIGPEVIIKGLHSSAINLKSSIPVIIGREHVLNYYSDLLHKNISYELLGDFNQVKSNNVYLLPVGDFDPEVCPGHLTAESGKLSMQSVESAISHTLSGDCDAMVTAPINKEAIHEAGYHFPGHTELLAQKTGTDYPLMMMLSNKLNIGLVTTHIPLSQVSSSIKDTDITRSVHILNDTLRSAMNIEHPHIAILGLNPHAGDGGVLGEDEINVINPAVNRLREQGLNLDGPFPADGFFGRGSYQYYDAVLAMYHDQGLIPFKLLSTNEGVNFTAGLPIIRTSPDHGTAYAISGLMQADCSSFVEAYNRAVTMALNRRSAFKHERNY